ncbi:hypothetical protein PAMA_015702 [Pampus argenteus]
MMKHMQKVLEEELSGDLVEPEAPQSLQGAPTINSSLLETRIHHLRESLCQRLGPEVFQKLYENLKEARSLQDREDKEEDNITEVDESEDGFQVDQLLFYEEELQRVRQLQEDRPPV